MDLESISDLILENQNLIKQILDLLKSNLKAKGMIICKAKFNKTNFKFSKIKFKWKGAIL